MTASTNPRTRTIRLRIARWLRRQSWWRAGRDGTLRGRVHALLTSRHPWWDWGHHLMIVVGQNIGGNWSQPEPPTWHYRLGPPKRMWRTGYPTHPPRTFDLIRGDYDEFRRRYNGLSEDDQYQWRAICSSQDDDLHLGRQYWGGRYYGLTKPETALLLRWLVLWRFRDWFGLRSWLFSQALHAAVYRRKPGACHIAPGKGDGGYDHWLCDLPRRHEGLHRFRNYEWGEVGGHKIRATHRPRVRSTPTGGVCDGR